MEITKGKSPQYPHQPFEPTFADVAAAYIPTEPHPTQISIWNEWEEGAQDAYEDFLGRQHEEQQAWIENKEEELSHVDGAPSPLDYAMDQALVAYWEADMALSQLAALAVRYCGRSAASIERRYGLGHTAMTRRIEEGDNATVRGIAARALRQRADSFAAAAEALENSATTAQVTDK